LNGGIFVMIISIWIIETFGVAGAPLPADQRTADKQVVLALVAASAAQLGLLALSVGRALSQFLLPKR
jgi:uncharacterized iron-regulated membrane protein